MTAALVVASVILVIVLGGLAWLYRPTRTPGTGPLPPVSMFGTEPDPPREFWDAMVDLDTAISRQEAALEAHEARMGRLERGLQLHTRALTQLTGIAREDLKP